MGMSRGLGPLKAVTLKRPGVKPGRAGGFAVQVIADDSISLNRTPLWTPMAPAQPEPPYQGDGRSQDGEYHRPGHDRAQTAEDYREAEQLVSCVRSSSRFSSRSGDGVLTRLP